MRRRARPRVLIAGGGVAGLETLLALRAMAGDRVDITLVAPEAKFVNRSMAVDQPSSVRGVRGLKLRDITGELGARWHRATVERVDHERHVVVTEKGRELPYDRLVLALGARSGARVAVGGRAHLPRRRATPTSTVVCCDSSRTAACSRVAFVKPGGASWPLPLYELALATAADATRAA